MNQYVGYAMVASGLMLSTVPWERVDELLNEPPRAHASPACSRYDVNCGELFHGRVACMNYHHQSHGLQVISWDAQGHRLLLPLTQCVFSRVE